jgi:Uma2 family endonuclease
MAALPAFITVEELYTIDTPERCELHGGIIVPVTAPASKHEKMQWRLRHLLERSLGDGWFVATEIAYRPLPQFEIRRGDVVAISQTRWDAVDPDDNVYGAPELVIEIRSPSNTARQLRELSDLCLANGCQSFWVVDIAKRTVTTSERRDRSAVFEIGDEVPLIVVPGKLAVREIFANER